MQPEDILPTYERVAEAFARQRNRSGFEAPWLARLLEGMRDPQVLNLGCGTGLPLARLMACAGARVTGVDGAAAMIRLFRRNMPGHAAVHADMRGLDLRRRFDALLAFDSFFHLSPADQRAMFPVFARHLRPGGRVLITTGPAAGEAWGTVGGAPVYHASLDPQEYAALWQEHGFDVLRHAPEAEDCDRHTLWLCQRRADAAPTGA